MKGSLVAETAPIRVLIVDHHEGVRLGLRTALATIDDIQVIGEAASGVEALLLARQIRPDVILMEVQLPDRDGISTMQLIRERDRHVQVVILTAAHGAELRQRAEQAGARGYLQKYVSVEEILRVIRAASTERIETEKETPMDMHKTNSKSMDATFSRDITGLAPAIATPVVDLADGDSYDLNAAPVRQFIGGAEVRLLAYNGSVPGPTLRVRQGSTVTVNFTNETDLETTVHWHGLRHENRFDGVPEGIHQGMQPPISVGGSYTYELHFPDPGVYWYHPHIREDYTQELGLYANIVVVPAEPDYWAPVNREVTLVLDDILLEDGQVAPFSRELSNHTAMGRYGNVLLVNGSDSYQFEARQGEVLRLYLTNTANARPFNVRIPGAQLKLVGGDLGRVERETFVDEVLLAPAERVVVDALFEHAGRFAIEHQTPDQTYTIGTIVVDQPVDRSFAAEFLTLRRNAELEAIRAQIDADFDRAPDKALRIVGEMPGMSHQHGGHEMHAHQAGHMGHGGAEHGDHAMHQMHGHGSHEAPPMDHASHASHSMGHHGAHQAHEISPHGGHEAVEIEWEDTMPKMNRMSTPRNMFWKLIDQETGKANHEIEWSFSAGEQIKIRLVNAPDSDHPMQHPIHFHGQRFLVLARDGVRNENLAWEDTVLVRGGETVDILLDAANPGAWMVHCHIAEHLESHMMFTLWVREGGQSGHVHAAGHHGHH